MSDTVYVIRDWTSAVNVVNEINNKLKINVSIYKDSNNIDIEGYSLEVYEASNTNIKCPNLFNKIIYKFDVECTRPNHYTLSTQEAITFLNTIGFRCEFDYSVFNISDVVREQLTNISNLGYKTIVRTIRPWTKVYISTKPADDIAKKLEYTDLEYLSLLSYSQDIFAPGIFKYQDYMFLPPNVPTPISEILKN